MATKIKALENYIINEVKRLRITLNITQSELSEQINNNPESNFVGSVENNKKATGYNDHHLNIFADYFTYAASKLDEKTLKERELKKEYNIEDFYPKKPIAESIVEKNILHVPKSLFPSGAITILVEEKNVFLNKWRTIKEICDFCNKVFNKNWTQNHFTNTLIRANNEGKLLRLSEDVAKYKHIN